MRLGLIYFYYFLLALSFLYWTAFEILWVILIGDMFIHGHIFDNTFDLILYSLILIFAVLLINVLYVYSFLKFKKFIKLKNAKIIDYILTFLPFIIFNYVIYDIVFTFPLFDYFDLTIEAIRALVH